MDNDFGQALRQIPAHAINNESKTSLEDVFLSNERTSTHSCSPIIDECKKEFTR
jgi:hypothetical protein